MHRKRLFVFVAAMVLGGALSVTAAEVVLVYPNRAAVEAAEFDVGVVAGSDVLWKPGAGCGVRLSTGVLVGFYTGALRSVLGAWDGGPLGTVLLKPGDLIDDERAVARHGETLSVWVSMVGTDAAPVRQASTQPGAPWDVLIDGQPVGDDPVHITVRRRRAHFELGVVRTSTVPVWGVAVTLTSDPSLLFWRKGQPKGIGEGAQRTLVIRHQAIFKRIGPGDGLRVPVEITSIKEEAHTWDVEVQAGDERTTRRIQVQLKPREK